MGFSVWLLYSKAACNNWDGYIVLRGKNPSPYLHRGIDFSNDINETIEEGSRFKLFNTDICFWRAPQKSIQPSMVTRKQNSCSAFTHPRAHTQQWTHTPWTQHPEQWAAILCCGTRGAVWGSVPWSRTPQSWYWGWRDFPLLLLIIMIYLKIIIKLYVLPLFVYLSLVRFWFCWLVLFMVFLYLLVLTLCLWLFFYPYENISLT